MFSVVGTPLAFLLLIVLLVYLFEGNANAHASSSQSSQLSTRSSSLSSRAPSAAPEDSTSYFFNLGQIIALTITGRQFVNLDDNDGSNPSTTSISPQRFISFFVRPDLYVDRLLTPSPSSSRLSWSCILHNTGTVLDNHVFQMRYQGDPTNPFNRKLILENDSIALSGLYDPDYRKLVKDLTDAEFYHSLSSMVADGMSHIWVIVPQ